MTWWKNEDEIEDTSADMDYADIVLGRPSAEDTDPEEEFPSDEEVEEETEEEGVPTCSNCYTIRTPAEPWCRKCGFNF